MADSKILVTYYYLIFGYLSVTFSITFTPWLFAHHRWAVTTFVLLSACTMAVGNLLELLFDKQGIPFVGMFRVVTYWLFPSALLCAATKVTSFFMLPAGFRSALGICLVSYLVGYLFNFIPLQHNIQWKADAAISLAGVAINAAVFLALPIEFYLLTLVSALILMVLPLREAIKDWSLWWCWSSIMVLGAAFCTLVASW